MSNFTFSIPSNSIPAGAFMAGAICGGVAVGALNYEKTEANLKKVWTQCTLANVFVACGYVWLGCQARSFLINRAGDLLTKE